MLLLQAHGVSVLEWSEALPECHDSETLPLAHGVSGFAAVAKASRPFLGDDEHEASGYRRTGMVVNWHDAFGDHR
jgi:hypothetical protein